MWEYFEVVGFIVLTEKDFKMPLFRLFWSFKPQYISI